MNEDLRGFWNHVQTRLEVAVASSARLPDKMLGVRDGFRTYFHEGLALPVEVSVSPRLRVDDDPILPMTDEEILGLARRRAHAQATTRREEGIDFVVGSESGLVPTSVDDEHRHLVRTWTVVIGPGGHEAWGSGGALQIPQRLLDDTDALGPIPGTRRGGGMLQALTFGIVTRRTATALSTVHALSSLLYGLVGERPRVR
ncbi:MAG: DUF84 family protein [Acidobacteriota bacterium]